MIAIVDYGLGNLGSVTKGFRHAGAETVLTGDPAELRAAEALVLPGDGAFGATMDEIRGRGLDPVLREAAARGMPLFGICIGMQVLFEESEEHGRHRGPGPPARPGAAFRRPPARAPHGLEPAAPSRPHPLLDGLTPGSHVYFVHSYFCDAPEDVVLATSDYGRDFAAVVGRGNVLGVQFHPEKSQAVGLRLIAELRAASWRAADQQRRTA